MKEEQEFLNEDETREEEEVYHDIGRDDLTKNGDEPTIEEGKNR